MKYAGWGLFIRSDIPIGVIRDIVRIGMASVGASFLRRLFYNRRVIELIVDRPASVRWWHAFWVNRVLQAAELISRQVVDRPGDPLQEIENLVMWMAPRVGKTPAEIYHGVDYRQINHYVDEICRRDLDAAASAIKAQHIPMDYSNEIMRKREQITRRLERVENRIEEIEERVEEIAEINTAGIFARACG